MVELTAGATLTIDVGAICDNWKAIRRRIGRTDCGARDAGTIGYEILTALGDRYERTYVGALQ